MITWRTVILCFLSCWTLSIPIIVFNLDDYHTHSRQLPRAGCSQYMCNTGAEIDDDILRIRSAAKHTGTHRTSVWPSANETRDRIVEQLLLDNEVPGDPKVILLYSKINDVNQNNKGSLFNGCPVSNCRVTMDKSQVPVADVIVGRDISLRTYEREHGARRRDDQVILWYQLESAARNPSPGRTVLNWTATYRRDSTITAPYGKYFQFKAPVDLSSQTNYAQGKSGVVAAFISNCASTNGRLRYAKNLRKHIDVHIYGSCGKYTCTKKNNAKCQEMLKREYKFYLSFENANCKDYITEKFFDFGLDNDIVPVVMGAAPEDYAAIAPPHSYIHVDDFDSPQTLAEYLDLLDKHDTLYNEYFNWKHSWTPINTRFWCRVCAMIHEAHLTGTHMWYTDSDDWWRNPDVCITAKGRPSSWRDRAREHSDTGAIHRVVNGRSVI